MLKAYTRKRAGQHVDPRAEVYTHVYSAYTPKWAGPGTWIHFRRRTATYTGPIRRKGLAQGRGSTCGGLQPRAQGLHTEKGRNSHVDPRPEAYNNVQRAYTPKRASTGTWSLSGGLQPRAQGLHTEKGRYIHVDQRP